MIAYEVRLIIKIINNFFKTKRHFLFSLNFEKPVKIWLNIPGSEEPISTTNK